MPSVSTRLHPFSEPLHSCYGRGRHASGVRSARKRHLMLRDRLSPIVSASGVSTRVHEERSTALEPVRQRYPVRRQATSLEGSEEDVRQPQKVRHAGVEGLFEYAHRLCGGVFPSKLDVAG